MNAEVLSGTVLGTCTLQKVIGRGGTGAVFLAQQSRPRRQVAVKVLLPITKLQPSQQAAFIERFRRETDAAASLDHPNILPVHECGESNGLAYLVMPYVSGGTLRDELEKEGKLPLTRTVSYLDQIAAALDFAHKRGIIHRDIKPANLLMTSDKRLMLTDFGLVKIIAGSQPTQNPLSDSGLPIGTPDYMAPEQVLGGEIDARADIYSLGIILYQMVTGTVPFKGEMPMKVALQHLNTLPPQPRTFRPDLPPEAEEVILRALAKRSNSRYASAYELANAFRQALEAAGVQVEDRANGPANSDDAAGNRPRGLFDPVWQGSVTPEQASDNRSPASPPAGRKMADMITLVDTFTEPSADGYASTPSSTNTHPSSTKLAKKLLVAHQDQNKAKGNAQQPISPAPTPNGQRRSFMRAPNTPTPPTPADMQNGQNAPQRLRFGQYAFQQQTAQPTQTERATNEVAQPFQFSPTGPAGFHEYNLDSKTTPVQTVQIDGETTPVQAIQTDNIPGVQPGAVPKNYNNEQNGLGARNPGTAPLGPANRPDEQRGLVTRQLDTNTFSPDNGQQPRTTRQLGPVTGMLPVPGSTTNLQHPAGEYSGDTGMLKLYQPVKVVKVPIAGQPGQYMTGILQVVPRPQAQTGALPPPAHTDTTPKSKTQKYGKIIVLVIAILAIILTSSIYALTRPAPVTHTDTTKQSAGTTKTNDPNATATASINATATVEETNLIQDDPLNENIHNWRQGSYQGQHYEFKDGAYHVRNDAKVTTLAAQFNLPLPTKYSYSLTMQQVKGDQNSPFNFYGLLLRYSEDKKQVPTFYFFSIINDKGQSKYQFRRYDGHTPKDQNPWVATPFEHAAGNELHKGNDPNIVKIIVDGSHFTFLVNGKQVGTAQDTKYAETGSLGMGVNQQGSEVAFTKFRLVGLP